LSRFHCPPSGCPSRHQQAGLAAHLAIEELHHEIVARLCPGLEFQYPADEAIVGKHVDGDAESPGPAVDHRLHAPFARLDYADRGWGVAPHRALYLAAEAAAIVGIVEPYIVDIPAFGLQFRREMPHRREDQCDLRLVVPDVGRLLRNLHHQDDGVVLRHAPERGKAVRQLIAEYGDEDRHSSANARVRRRDARPQSVAHHSAALRRSRPLTI
jgi:hypothetical protein